MATTDEWWRCVECERPAGASIAAGWVIAYAPGRLPRLTCPDCLGAD